MIGRGVPFISNGERNPGVYREDERKTESIATSPALQRGGLGLFCALGGYSQGAIA